MNYLTALTVVGSFIMVVAMIGYWYYASKIVNSYYRRIIKFRTLMKESSNPSELTTCQEILTKLYREVVLFVTPYLMLGLGVNYVSYLILVGKFPF